MKSNDTLLAEAIDRLREAGRLKAFYARKAKLGDSATVETLIAEAKTALAEAPQARIRRNNSGGFVQESKEPFAEVDRLIIESIERRTGRSAKSADASALEALSESQRKEYDFCLMLRMSPDDALRVAKAS